MTTIYKYELAITGLQTISIPGNGNREELDILHVGLDPSGTPCVWVHLDPSLSPASYTFIIVGTGAKMPAEAGYHLGSFVQGPFVWHVFNSK